MSRIRVYRLPEAPYEFCVSHKELYQHLGFFDGVREARHVFDSEIRAAIKRAGFKEPEPIVLTGDRVTEFNNMVHKDHGFRFQLTKIRVYTGEGVAFVLAALGKEDQDLLTRLDSHIGNPSPLANFEAFKKRFQAQAPLFTKTPAAAKRPPAPIVPKPAKRPAAPVSVPAPSTLVVSPVATLSAVMIALNEWVKAGKLSGDLADRYLADYMQRNNVLDLSTEPPELPPGLRGNGGFNRPTPSKPVTTPAQAAAAPVAPAAVVPTNGHTLPFKAGLRPPFVTAIDIYRSLLLDHGSKLLDLVGINTPHDIPRVAREAKIYQNTYWGRETDGEWYYDVDATRHLKDIIDKMVTSAHSAPPLSAHA
jgi:hypothetical protein